MSQIRALRLLLGVAAEPMTVVERPAKHFVIICCMTSECVTRYPVQPGTPALQKLTLQYTQSHGG